MLSKNILLNDNIIAVDVYLEFRKTKKYVGRLKEEKNEFIFTYDNEYLRLDRSIPIGPDIPLTKKIHKSISMFSSFDDRIPSKNNPAYEEYCEKFDLNPNEKNKIILLATIGRRGPSSFVFEPVYKDLVTEGERAQFRKKLGLTIREFAAVFDLSTKTVVKIEKGNKVGRDTIKKIDTYILFPEVATLEVHLNGGILMSAKREDVIKKLK
ncbi:MAG: HipA N-terminal domain-containing protein [Bdellovibrionales bacterium]|nr:HipA N-terminal domain-containing protein [Bdellovibrionales bacterium]